MIIYLYITTKINRHIPSGYCSFDVAKNKLDYYRGKDCVKNFCKDLKGAHNKNNQI